MQFALTLDFQFAKEFELNLTQTALFGYIAQSPIWAETIIINNEVWYWASRNKIVEELPTVFNTADSVYRNLKVLTQKGLINYSKVEGKDLISFTNLGKKWLKFDNNGNPNSEKNLPNTWKKIRKNSEKFPNKLGKISDRSNNHRSNNQDHPPKSPRGEQGVCSAFEKVWEKYTSNPKAKKTGKTAAEKQFKKLKLDGGEVKQILNAIQSHWENDPSWKRGYQPELKNFLRDERWKDQIVADKPTQSRNPACLTPEQEVQREKERNNRELQEATSYVRDFESENSITEATFKTLHKNKTLLTHKYLICLSRVNREKYLKLSKALKNDASTNS